VNTAAISAIPCTVSPYRNEDRDRIHWLVDCWRWTLRRSAVTDIDEMVDTILDDRPQELTGYAVGDCLYLRRSGNPDAWIEGKAVHLGDWR